MTEYLDRESVLGILDGFLKAHEKILDNPPECNLVYHAMRKLPTADVVEVVRCANCDFCDNTMRCQCDSSCKGLIREDNDFCSYGIPKEREE